MLPAVGLGVAQIFKTMSFRGTLRAEESLFGLDPGKEGFFAQNRRSE